MIYIPFTALMMLLSLGNSAFLLPISHPVKKTELTTHMIHGNHKPLLVNDSNTDSKVHGANMGPIWGRQDPGGSNFGPMNFAIWE